MNIRQWLNQNSALSSAGASLLLIACLGFLGWNLLAPRGESDLGTYFLDRNTNQLVEKQWTVSPTATGSGQYQGEPAGIRAYVYACGGCADSYVGMTPQQLEASGAFIGYLKKVSPQVRDRIQRIQEKATPNQETPDQGQGPGDLAYDAAATYIQNAVVKPVNGDKWVKANSKAGGEMIDRVRQCDNGSKAQECHPR
jgi:hypothetical protein